MNKMVFVAFFLFFAIGADRPFAQSQTLEDSVATFIYSGFDYDFGETVAEVFDALGAPESMDTMYTQNPYADTLDAIYTMRYPGLLFYYYWVSKWEYGMPLAIDVFEDQYNIKYGLNIGTDEKQISRRLGPPWQEEYEPLGADTLHILRYVNRDDAMPHYVFFTTENQNITRIEWVYNPD